MYGCYLTYDDDKFVDLITDELDNYNSSNDISFILLFPSLSARHRLILHRLRENNYSNLFSFSVGEERNTRRTIICFKSQLMDDINVTSSSNDTSTSLKTTSSLTATQSNGESSTKRRPAQALYKPPRRSKDLEPVSPSPTLPPSSITPTISGEDVQQDNSTTKPTKSKTARPSAEPYLPPSRRSQLANKELPPSTSITNENKKDNDDGEKEEEQEEEDWEKLLDININPPKNDLVDEIQKKFKENVQIKKPTNNYSQWSVDDIQVQEADFAHVVEVSNFPSNFRTEDLSTAFKTITRSIFDIKWVDDTHALVVFPDAKIALDALQMEHPMFKVCPLSQASTASKKKAKNATEFLQPYRTRPETTTLTANRRICAALGLKNPMSSDKAKSEREKIETARKQKNRDKEEQNTVWDGGVLPSTPTT